jgi:hypothetical protein
VTATNATATADSTTTDVTTTDVPSASVSAAASPGVGVSDASYREQRTYHRERDECVAHDCRQCIDHTGRPALTRSRVTAPAEVE